MQKSLGFQAGHNLVYNKVLLRTLPQTIVMVVMVISIKSNVDVPVETFAVLNLLIDTNCGHTLDFPRLRPQINPVL